MKKSFFLTTAAVLTGLFSIQPAGAQQFIQQELLKEDYENTTDHGWAGLSTLELVVDDSGNHYYQNGNTESGKTRASYKYFPTDCESLTGVSDWGMEFDLQLQYAIRSDKGPASFSVEGRKNYYAKYNGVREIYKYLEIRQHNSNSTSDSLFYVLHNNSGSNMGIDTVGSVELDPSKWYHYEFSVSENTLAHFILSDPATGDNLVDTTYTVEPDSLGAFYLLHTSPGCHNGRGTRYSNFDNLIVYKLVDINHIEKPQAAITKVQDTQRQLTLTCPTAGVTFDYQITTQTDSFKVWSDWIAYSKPFLISEPSRIFIRAQKNGYAAYSDTLRFSAGTTVKLVRPTLSSPAYNEETQTYTVTMSTNVTDVQLKPAAFLSYSIDGKAFKTAQNKTTIDLPKGSTYAIFARYPGYVNSDTLHGKVEEPYDKLYATQMDFKTFNTYVYGGTIFYGDRLFNYTTPDTTYAVQRIVTQIDTLTMEPIQIFDGPVGLIDMPYNTGGWMFRNNNFQCLYNVGWVGLPGLQRGQLIELESSTPTAQNDVAEADPIHTTDGYQFRVRRDGNFVFTISNNGTLSTITTFDQKAKTSAKNRGWMVYVNPSGKDVELPFNVQAYTINEIDTLETINPVDSTATCKLSLRLVQDGIIPANAAVLVKAKAGEYFDIKLATDTATGDFATNKLIGCRSFNKIGGAVDIFHHYVFGLTDEEHGQPVMKLGSNPLLALAYTAYLTRDVRTDLARDSMWIVPSYYTFEFLPGQEPIYYEEDDKIDALREPVLRDSFDDERYYDILGRRLPGIPEKGLYIHKGKKYIVL